MPTTLSEDTFRFLEGRSVELICFAQYSLFIHFDDEILLTIEGEFSYGRSGIHFSQMKFPIYSSCIMRILSNKVTLVKFNTDYILRIEFSNEDLLLLRPQQSPYESYRVKYKELEIVI